MELLPRALLGGCWVRICSQLLSDLFSNDGFLYEPIRTSCCCLGLTFGWRLDRVPLGALRLYIYPSATSCSLLRPFLHHLSWRAPGVTGAVGRRKMLCDAVSLSLSLAVSLYLPHPLFDRSACLRPCRPRGHFHIHRFYTLKRCGAGLLRQLIRKDVTASYLPLQSHSL